MAYQLRTVSTDLFRIDQLFLKVWEHALQRITNTHYDYPQQLGLKATESSRHGKMKRNGFLIEHFGIQRVVVVILYGALKTGNLKNDIPDLAHRSWGGFLEH